MSYQNKARIQLTIPIILLGMLILLMGGNFFPSEYLPNRIASSNSATKDSVNLREMFRVTLDSVRIRYGFPGATAAYMWKDGEFGAAATGLSDLENGALMTAKSRMLSASIGKTFVGAIAVQLAHEGVLDLDVPIQQWLGDRTWFQRLPNHKRITLRQLLTHRSGLPNHVFMPEFADQANRRWREQKLPFPPDSLVQFVLDKPPLFEAGKGWAYTDTGFILAGMIIEEATNRDYYEIVQDQFLKPLELTYTSPSNSRHLPGLASGYAEENPFGFPVKTTLDDGKMAWHPGIEWTGGGLVTTSGDLARWGAALFSGKALPEASRKLLLTSSSIDPSNPDVHYGMGVAIYQKSQFGTVYGHGGWIPGYTSSLRYYSEYGVAIAFQINTDIGIMNDTSSVVPKMESKLAETVLSSRER